MRRGLAFVIALVCGVAPGFAGTGDVDDRCLEVFSETMHAQLTKKGGVTVYASQQENYISPADTPLSAAVEYLRRYAKELDFKAELLRTNLVPAKKFEPSAGEEYRLWEDASYRANNPNIIIFTQTYYGLPVSDGAVQVNLVPQSDGKLWVIGATLTRHPDLAVDKPPAKSLARLEKFNDKDFAKALGLDGVGQTAKTNQTDSQELPGLPQGYPRPYEVDGKWIKITSREWVIHRYDAGRRVVIGSNTFAPAPQPHFPLPPMDKRIEDRHDYVVMHFTFMGRGPAGHVYIEPETRAVLYLNAW